MCSSNDCGDPLKYWRNFSDVSVHLPASDIEIFRFEKSRSIELPREFVCYLKCANGFDQSKNYKDSNGFNFWPLETLSCAAEYDDGTWSFNKAEEYYIFCDYFDLSWAYAIRVKGSNKGEIVRIGASDGNPHLVARNFCDFLALYIRNDLKLYP